MECKRNTKISHRARNSRKAKKIHNDRLGTVITARLLQSDQIKRYGKRMARRVANIVLTESA